MLGAKRRQRLGVLARLCGHFAERHRVLLLLLLVRVCELSQPRVVLQVPVCIDQSDAVVVPWALRALPWGEPLRVAHVAPGASREEHRHDVLVAVRAGGVQRGAGARRRRVGICVGLQQPLHSGGAPACAGGEQPRASIGIPATHVHQGGLRCVSHRLRALSQPCRVLQRPAAPCAPGSPTACSSIVQAVEHCATTAVRVPPIPPLRGALSRRSPPCALASNFANSTNRSRFSARSPFGGEKSTLDTRQDSNLQPLRVAVSASVYRYASIGSSAVVVSRITQRR